MKSLNPAAPSVTTKGATTKLAESIHELAVGQKHLTLPVCKNVGITLPKELSQYSHSSLKLSISSLSNTDGRFF